MTEREENKKIIKSEVSDIQSDASLLKYAVIVAGGKGLRAGGEIPKQFQPLCGRPMLWWSMRHFVEEDPATKIVLVLNETYVDLWNDLFAALPDVDKIAHMQVVGGKERFHSVLNGLSAIPPSSDGSIFIAIHDAARPLAFPELIRRGWKKSISRRAGVVPVIPLSESIRIKTNDSEEISECIDRNKFLIVQTPQIFPLSILRKAYKSDFKTEFTDDASVVESIGEKIYNFEGDSINMKVTKPEDFIIAAQLLNSKL